MGFEKLLAALVCFGNLYRIKRGSQRCSSSFSSKQLESALIFLWLVSDEEELLQQLHQADEAGPGAPALRVARCLRHQQDEALRHRKHLEREGLRFKSFTVQSP